MSGDVEALAGLAQYKTGPEGFQPIYVVQEHQLLDWLAAHDAAERDRAAKPDWSNCVHGVKDGCASYRCGSNCNQTYDRMHPCLACQTAKVVALRAALPDDREGASS